MLYTFDVSGQYVLLIHQRVCIFMGKQYMLLITFLINLYILHELSWI